MSHRIFVTGSGITAEAMELLKADGCAVEVGDPRDTPQQLAEKLQAFDPDGLIVRQGKITAEVQDAPAHLKVICKHGVGTDNIDIQAATDRGIPVLFTPQANFEAVAEHTLALMLALVRQIPAQDRRVKTGVFDKRGYDGLELLDKCLGLVGFGRIGKRVSELVAPFRMKVLAYDPYCRVDSARQPHVSAVQNLEDMLRAADIVSLHCPLTPETKGIINKRTLAMMKQGAYLINVARGGVVNERELVAALQEKRIAGAALDVFEVEPPATDNPLLESDRVIVTTHVASMSDNSVSNMGRDAVSHVLAVLKGEPIDAEALLNKAVLETA